MTEKTDIDTLYKKMIYEIQDYAIILLDSEGMILSWNKGAEKIKGYTEPEIIGRDFRIFYTPEDRQASLPEQLIQTAITEGKSKQIGKRVKKDGTIFWASTLITALHDEDGYVIGFTKLTREIVQRQ